MSWGEDQGLASKGFGGLHDHAYHDVQLPVTQQLPSFLDQCVLEARGMSYTEEPPTRFVS